MTKVKSSQVATSHLSVPDDIAKADELSQQVLNSTLSAMAAYGNALTDGHKKALDILAKSLAYSLFAKIGKRTLVPLFTGGGKTQTVISHAATVIQKGIDKGIWISVGTIEEIQGIADALEARGVSRKLIGRKHSKSDSNVTSNNAINFPIILSTHERIRSCDYDDLIMYKDKRRQLIWDEALISTKTHFMKMDKLFDEIHKWKSAYEISKLRNAASDSQIDTEIYLDSLLNVIRVANDRSVVELPDHPGRLSLGLYSAPLLESIEFPVSKEAYIDKDSHIFNWCVTVPDEFENIVILDASGGHRLLERYDSSILIYPINIDKDYSEATIHYCKAFVGKSTVDDPSKNLLMYEEIAHIISSLEDDKKVVCFHLPEKAGVEYPPQRMNLSLKDPKDRGRVIYRSWGESKGVNSLSDIKYGVHIGMIYRDSTELATAISAQKRETLSSIDDKERHEVQLSEHADQVYQAMNRLHCRHTIDGKASHTEFWLFYPDHKLLSYLKELMPGVNICTYEPSFLERKEDAYLNARKIKDWVAVSDRDQVSIRTIKRVLGINIGKDSTIWRDSRAILSRELPAIGYKLEPRARSIKKIPVLH